VATTLRDFTLQYAWFVTDEIVSECDSAKNDRFGFCGDAAATESVGLVCQKIAVSALGAEVLLYNVNVTAIPGNATNGCTNAMKPPTTYSCAKRDCEVVRADRTTGKCFSFRGLPCGAASKPVRGRCFSVSLGTYISNTRFWSGECKSLAGFAMQPCDPVADNFPLCAAGNMWQHGSWSACKDADGTQLSCGTCTTYTDGVCAMTGTSTRLAKCVTVDASGVVGAEVADSLCTGSSDASKSCAKSCSQKFTYYVSDWPEICDASCACAGDAGADSLPACAANTRTGTQTREVLDCDLPAVAAANVEKCATAKSLRAIPAATRPCTAEAGPVCNACVLPTGKPFCTPDNTLSCTDFGGTAACICKPGFEGSRCHRKAGSRLIAADGSTCAGVLNVRDGTCCESGVLDRTGTCCKGDNAQQDACGMCQAEGVSHVGLDRTGKCCGSDAFANPAPFAFLDGSLQCCSGPDALDDCGVCDGDGSSCGKRIDSSLDPSGAVTDFDNYLGAACGAGAQLQQIDVDTGAETAIAADSPLAAPPMESPRRSLLATTPRAFGLPPLAEIIIESPMFVGKFLVAGDNAASAGVLLAAPDMPTVAIVPQPGNGVCETGEEPSTSEGDCIAPILCEAPVSIGNPSRPCGGNGVCDISTGFCMCNTGYADSDCGACDSTIGYAEYPSGAGWSQCTQLTDDFTPLPRKRDPNEVIDKDDILTVGAIIGIVIGGVAAVAIIVGVTYYVARRRSAKMVTPAS